MTPNNSIALRQTVADVMTRAVVTASETTPYKDLVELVTRHRIGAVPVIDAERRPVGMVSETDLLLKEAPPEHTALSGLWRSTRRLEHKAEASTAGELMSTPAIVATTDMLVGEAAKLMRERDVTHLPVVGADGTVDGIVSRGDLLKPFLRPDDEIRRDIIEKVLVNWLWVDPANVVVDVSRGEVVVSGRIDRRSSVELVTRIVRSLDGVVSVDNRLEYDFDDLHAPRPAAEEPVPEAQV